MRFLVALVMAVMLFSQFSCGPSISSNQAIQHHGSHQSDRNEVITVFQKAIELNEEFKSGAKEAPQSEHRKMRRELERYHEEVLSPELEICVKLLSSGKDKDLASEFFKLLISFENSADEQLSYSFGEVFLNNPELVEETFGEFSPVERDSLYRQLQWGWENVILAKDLPEATIRDRIERLKRLKSQ